MNTPSIQEVVAQVFQSSFLSLEQESLINELLLQGRYSEADLEILEQLTLALLSQKVAVEKPISASAA
ncbi:hypothetical protein NW817_06580 [Synechococcus sp. H65.1]|uniref:hypothetical protein n=1 Tax=Synechococcus sp. H65.1 TaxID=2964525 RepID=UPI0039C3CADB